MVNREAVTDAVETGRSPADSESLTFDVAKPFADVYADSVQVSTGPFGMALTFAVSNPDESARRDVVTRVRLSPQLGFVLAQLLRKVLKKGAADGIEHGVPDEVLRTLELEKDL